MILVNSTWGEDSFEMLLHSEWNGITPCDFIFPVFIYIVGISCYLSLNKKEFKATNTVLIHITKNSVIVLGWTCHKLGFFINKRNPNQFRTS